VFSRPLLDASRHRQSAPDDLEVRAAQAVIPTYPPVAELLATQERHGYWGKGDYYLPRAGRGTFWVLSVLGDLGTHCRGGTRTAGVRLDVHAPTGGRRILPPPASLGPGDGVAGAHGTCTHARIVRFCFSLATPKTHACGRHRLAPADPRDDGMCHAAVLGSRLPAGYA